MQLCKFNIRPDTIVNGGLKKGRYIVWLNLNVVEANAQDDTLEPFESFTDRLILSNHDITSFLEAVDEKHIAIATNDEIMAIMQYFKVESDIQSWKAIRQLQIKGYDQTENVNKFYLIGQPLWLDKATRVGLVNSISAEKRSGCLLTDLWFGNTMIQLPVDEALSKLDQIELYAKECYNVTAKHIADVEQTDSIQELQEYDITLDYPSFLELNIIE